MALEELWSRTTRTDRALVLAIALLALVSLFLVAGRSVGQTVLISAGDKLVYIGPLGQDRTLKVHGPLGDTVIEIAAAKVRVTSSPCPRKICLAMGTVQHSGDLLACVPNLVVIRIEGEEAKGYDLLSR